MKQLPQCIVAGLVGFGVIFSAGHARSTAYANYVVLADAMLHGHLWIAPNPYVDSLTYWGRQWVIEAPLPAIVLLPFVAIFGLSTNQTLMAIVLGAIAVGAAWELTRRHGTSVEASIWLTAFFLAGTDLWWCAMLGDVWFVAEVSGVCFTMLALVELAGARRGWLIALFAACSFESRFTMIAALPVYMYLTLRGRDRAQVVHQALGFAAVLIPVAILWVLYNEARWQTWNDIGYAEWYHQDQAGSPMGSPFQLRYLPMQLFSFFVLWPVWFGKSPWLVPALTGTALTFTSPALIFAFWAREPRYLVLALWAVTALTAIPNVLYYVNGYDQFGMRHALDFEPFVFGLMILAARKHFPIWSQVLVAYSVIVGAWGVWFWNTFLRNGT